MGTGNYSNQIWLTVIVNVVRVITMMIETGASPRKFYMPPLRDGKATWLVLPIACPRNAHSSHDLSRHSNGEQMTQRLFAKVARKQRRPVNGILRSMPLPASPWSPNLHRDPPALTLSLTRHATRPDFRERCQNSGTLSGFDNFNRLANLLSIYERPMCLWKVIRGFINYACF